MLKGSLHKLNLSFGISYHLGQHIRRIFTCIDLFYVKWFTLHLLTNPMVSHIGVFFPCMVHEILAQIYCTLTATIDKYFIC